MSANVIGVPEAQLHLHIDRLPIGLQARHADARPQERRPEIDKPAQVPLHYCHIDPRPMRNGPRFHIAGRYATVVFGVVPYCFRSSRFITLPVPLLGKLSRNSTERGHLKCDSRERQNSKMSFSPACDPGFKTTSAFGASPHFWSGTGITTASYTSGWAVSTFSTSREDMFSPPLTMISFLRSTI